MKNHSIAYKASAGARFGWACALGIGALIYLFSPIDVIPDPVPVAGLIDDLGVLAYAVCKLWRTLRGNS